MSRAIGSISGPLRGLFLIAVTLSLWGCARKAEVVLHQPLAPPSQQNLKLAGDWAYHAADGEQESYAFAFPLPLSADGPRAFVIYIRVPNGARNITVDSDTPDGARGFLIQELGALAGRSDFVAGSLQYRPVLFAPRLRRVDFTVRGEDGSEIVGTAIVEDHPQKVQVFRREFAADIEQLALPAAEPATSSDETEPQPAAAPRAAARGAPVR